MSIMDSVLAGEDFAEDRRDLDPHERITCRYHRRWAHQCISSPAHVIPVTGHRWCRGCESPLSVAVDDLLGVVVLTCPRCGETPDNPATQQIVRTCQASFRASHGTELVNAA